MQITIHRENLKSLEDCARAIDHMIQQDNENGLRQSIVCFQLVPVTIERFVGLQNQFGEPNVTIVYDLIAVLENGMFTPLPPTVAERIGNNIADVEAELAKLNPDEDESDYAFQRGRKAGLEDALDCLGPSDESVEEND